MARKFLTLCTDENRRRAAAWCLGAEDNARFELKDPRRTLDQNAKMHAMLTDISRQRFWFGERLSKDDWKVLFLQALSQEARTVPNLAGDGFVSLGRGSSDLSIAEMSDMIELMYAWGADAAHPVKWSEPDLWHSDQSDSRERGPVTPAAASA